LLDDSVDVRLSLQTDLVVATSIKELYGRDTMHHHTLNATAPITSISSTSLQPQCLPAPRPTQPGQVLRQKRRLPVTPPTTSVNNTSLYHYYSVLSLNVVTFINKYVRTVGQELAERCCIGDGQTLTRWQHFAA